MRVVMPTTGPNSKGVQTFLEKQCLAHSKIILAIEPSQLPHVRNEENPFIIWQNLAQIHCAHGLGVHCLGVGLGWVKAIFAGP